MDDLFSFGEEEEMVLKAQEKEQKKMSEGDGFSLLGEEDMNGFGDFTSDDADEDLYYHRSSSAKFLDNWRICE